MRWYLAILLVGCNPQDAVVEGNWAIWLAGNSSATLAQEKVNVDDATSIDCLWTEEDIAYVGSTDDAPSCEDLALTAWQDWILDDGYYVLSEKIEPWRTEAVMNGEGDFQLTVHQDLGKGEDFRFAFAIHPDFAPVVCTSNESGDAEIAYVDGASWLEKWSEDEGDYYIYYLNAGAYQFNPSKDPNTSADAADGTNFWYLENDSRAGFSTAKWSQDNFNSYPTDYTWDDPQSCRKREPSRLLYPGQYFGKSGYFKEECDEDASYPTAEAYVAAMVDDLSTRSETWTEQWNSLYKAPSDINFQYKIEDNSWREIDDLGTGLDGWAEVNSSWVRVKKTSKLVDGGSAEGDFQIYYAGTEGTSHMVVTGTFKVDDIRTDKWAYSVLEDDKRDENGTPFCGGAAMP